MVERQPGVLLKATLKPPLYTQLLRTQEGTNDKGDGKVNIVRPHRLPQMHLRAGLGHADHTLEVSYCNRH